MIADSALLHAAREDGGAGNQASAAMFWCPMHPDIRSSEPGRCRECGMTLVPMPAQSAESFWLDVAEEPQAIAVGRPVRLRLTVRERGTSATVTRFEEMHERFMHLFVVSSDLTYFDHLHPEPRSDGAFEIALTFPRTGVYRLAADVLPAGSSPVLLQHTLITGNYAGTLAQSRARLTSESFEDHEGDVRAHFFPMGARAGDDAHVVVEFEDARSGQPVTDLESFLGASGHMLIASEDLEDLAHSHPLIQQTDANGPKLTFQTLFARAGWYQIWAQVQRSGRVLTFRFTVRVPSST
jgi:hypothetical protein